MTAVIMKRTWNSDLKRFFVKSEICLFIPWITGSLFPSMLYFQEIDLMANRIETIAEPPDGGVKVRPYQENIIRAG